MRIKPVFENLARSNENENLVFAAVNTQIRRDCAQAFGITAIPQFYFYVNGEQYREFKGADQNKLTSTLVEISEKAGKSKFVNHKNLSFKQFKPMNLAPQGFTSMQLLDKMKEFILKFAESEEAAKEVKSTENIKKWLATFKLENISREAIDELISLIEIAEDKSKIALIDLVRLIIMTDHQCAHVVNKHR